MVLYNKGIGGEIIRCTETHPFQVKDKGWVDAAELVPGDDVTTYIYTLLSSIFSN